MILNNGTTSYTFAQLPGTMTMIRPDKICDSVLTYSDVAYFSWGASIIGKEIILNWNAMPAAMWKSLDGLYAADLPCVWDPSLTGDPASTTYNVEMKQLDGEYLLGGYDEALSSSWRGNVSLTLLILSVVT